MTNEERMTFVQDVIEMFDYDITEAARQIVERWEADVADVHNDAVQAGRASEHGG